MRVDFDFDLLNFLLELLEVLGTFLLGTDVVVVD